MPTGNPFKPVATGDKARLNRDWYNAVSAATQARKQQRLGNSADPRGIFVPEGLIRVRNDSGADVPRFSVLGISGVVITPTTNQLEFTNRPAATGVTPTTTNHQGLFVVCYDPIPAGKIGQACVSGVCAVKVNINNAGDGWADVKNSDKTQLQSSGRGSARILWAESGTGSGKWAVVCLQAGDNQPGQIFRVNLTQTGGANGTQTTAATWTYTAKTLDNATTLGTVMSPERSRPNGTRTAATIGTGYYNASGTFVLYEADEKYGSGHC